MRESAHTLRTSLRETMTPIPFYILCGSLGAGKTTLLMRLLEHRKSHGKRAGVLMNEAARVPAPSPNK